MQIERAVDRIFNGVVAVSAHVSVDRISGA
jgi:hypothetical protein